MLATPSDSADWGELPSLRLPGNATPVLPFDDALAKPHAPAHAPWSESSSSRAISSGIWSGEEERDDGSISPSSSSSSAPPSPSSTATSCTMSPSSSAEFTLSPTTSAQKIFVNDWVPEAFSLKLVFTTSGTSVGPDDTDSCPPAFFPAARINFSPRLRITSPTGLPFSSLGGLHLGVTGMCETLDRDGNVKSKRMVADFCTDLSSGLKIWKRDAAKNMPKGEEWEGEESLPPGTYVLPLSMKIPNSDRLCVSLSSRLFFDSDDVHDRPPSFECSRFRIYYTMSIALFSAAVSTNGTPRRLKVFSIPFHVLPSTLPTPPPELPVLTHEHKKGVFASIIKNFSPFAAPKAERGYHIVYPSLPTSHFSPASHASIPVSLRIVDRPLEPTDLYIRLALVRKTYVRESTTTSMTAAIEQEWGLGAGTSPGSCGYPEEVIVEPYCKAEEEIVSRWGWIPYSSRPGADPLEQAEVIIRDIALPLSGLDGEGWSHGYSTGLDLEPTPVPSLQHGDCSWFSPAFRMRPPIAKEYQKHIHLSSRFFLSLEVGFAPAGLGDVLDAIGAASPDMEIPPPNTFTSPQRPSDSLFSGVDLSNPFHVPNLRSRRPSTPPPLSPAFPGRLRELFIPLTIGSVAEPAMSCIAAAGESVSRRAEREEREERGEDTRAELGEGADGAWLVAPPNYCDAVKSSPAYV